MFYKQFVGVRNANSCFSDSFIISILSWGVWDTVRYPKLFLKRHLAGAFCTALRRETSSFTCVNSGVSLLRGTKIPLQFTFSNSGVVVTCCGLAFLLSTKFSPRQSFSMQMGVNSGVAPSFGTKIPRQSTPSKMLGTEPSVDLYFCLVHFFHDSYF